MQEIIFFTIENIIGLIILSLALHLLVRGVRCTGHGYNQCWADECLSLTRQLGQLNFHLIKGNK